MHITTIVVILEKFSLTILLWMKRRSVGALTHREIVTGSSEKEHSVVCTSMSNKARWAPRPGVYGTTRKWPFSPQAAFTFCHHVTPDLARIDCSAVPGLFVKPSKPPSYCTRSPLVVAVISATRPRVLLLDVGEVSEVVEDVVLSIPVTLRP